MLVTVSGTLFRGIQSERTRLSRTFSLIFGGFSASLTFSLQGEGNVQLLLIQFLHFFISIALDSLLSLTDQLYQ